MSYPTFSQAGPFKDAMYAAALSLYSDSGDTPVSVFYGSPGPIPDENDVVTFGGVRSTQQFATMATNRTREELLELDVQMNARLGGGVESEQLCGQRAYALLGVLENYVRTTNSTLGGLVRWCFLTSHQSAGQTPPELVMSGRWITVDAVFTAPARISN